MDIPTAQPGYFVALEGTDGSGLTTQAARLRDRLRAAGRAAYGTKEPSEGPVGATIRLALAHRLGYPAYTEHRSGADTASAPLEPLADDLLALLYAADRLDHVRHDIAPRLARGIDVVCDRYRLSSLAYQALGADEAWLRTLNSKAPPPDLTIFLDVPPEVCQARMAVRGGLVELYEQEHKIARIRANYLRLIAAAQAAGERVVAVDGQGDPDTVAAAVWAACQAGRSGLY